MNKICMHCFVSGKVQGVWYRASTEKEAKKLGLTGWVRNLSDGRVEVMVCGEPETVNQLLAWLRRGPPLAVVSEVVHQAVPWEDHLDFVCR